MTKREIRKEAYRQIVKENRNHQEVFDELRGSAGMEVDTLATIIGGIPSPEKRQQNKALITVFIVVCSIVIVLRVLAILGMMATMSFNVPLLLLALALGLVVPAVAIFGAATWRVEMLQGSAGLFVLSLIRSFTNNTGDFDDPLILITVVPFVTAIVLAFLIPYRVKTKFTEKIITTETDGKKVSKKTVVFEKQEKIQSLDLLDS